MSDPTEVHLVIQQGGASTEMYVPAFDTRQQAEDYRTNAYEKGAYRTSEPLEVPVGIETYMEALHDIASAAASLV
jgi:hypothetical protein